MKVVLENNPSYFHYTATFVEKGEITKVPNYRTYNKLSVGGYTFYINQWADKTNYYALTEHESGIAVLRCVSNDPIVMKQRLQELVADSKRWKSLTDTVKAFLGKPTHKPIPTYLLFK